MKVHCKICGIHFSQDFEQTLKIPCNIWGDWGMSNVDVELKKKVWDWIFAMPADEFFLKTNMYIINMIGTKMATDSVPWEKIFSNYNEMSEEEQQQAQRAYFSGSVKYLGNKNDGTEN